MVSVKPQCKESAPASADSPQTNPNTIISVYLAKHIPEYRDLVELRKEGWNNPAADTHFEKERENADNPSEQGKDRFYNMTCQIGKELNTVARGAISFPFPPAKTLTVLDLCMAPGGFSTAALKCNPRHNVSLYGITLPVKMGGYDVRIPNWKTDPRIAEIKFLDITMLSGEMGLSDSDIPASHPDKDNFITERPFLDKQFDLIFCGGTVVRNHSQTLSEYRNHHEGTRLLTSQLVLGLERIRPGGTMVVVLHRADSWANVALFHLFSKFSDVTKMQLFKPKRAHARKASFYMVVRGVQPRAPEVVEAVGNWRRLWREATLLDDREQSRDSTDTFDDESGDVSTSLVESVLVSFGERLVKLTRSVFEIQAEALRSAPWVSKTATG